MDEGFSYTYIPDILEEESKKAKFNLLDNEKVIYIGVGVIVLVALIAFVYSITTSLNPPGTVGSGITPIADIPRIELNYSLELENGTVIYSGQESFLLSFVGKSLGLSKKVDEALEGLNKGEEISLNLTPEDAFGEYDEESIIEINRTERIERREEIDKDLVMAIADFQEEFKKEPVVGETYEVDGVPWNYTVKEVSLSFVTLIQEVKVGQIAPISDLFFLLISEVYEDNFVTLMTAENQTLNSENGPLKILTWKDEITLTLNPKVGQSIILGLNPNPAKVLSFNSEKIKLDYNSEFVGKNVLFNARIV